MPRKYVKYFYGISLLYVSIIRFNVPRSGTRISSGIYNKRRYEVAVIISVIRNDLVSQNLRPCISSETERVDGVSQVTASLKYITSIFTLVSTRSCCQYSSVWNKSERSQYTIMRRSGTVKHNKFLFF